MGVGVLVGGVFVCVCACGRVLACLYVLFLTFVFCFYKVNLISLVQPYMADFKKLTARDPQPVAAAKKVE